MCVPQACFTAKFVSLRPLLLVQSAILGPAAMRDVTLARQRAAGLTAWPGVRWGAYTNRATAPYGVYYVQSVNPIGPHLPMVYYA